MCSEICTSQRIQKASEDEYPDVVPGYIYLRSIIMHLKPQ
jgi:hypothetical protein